METTSTSEVLLPERLVQMFIKRLSALMHNKIPDHSDCASAWAAPIPGLLRTGYEWAGDPTTRPDGFVTRRWVGPEVLVLREGKLYVRITKGESPWTQDRSPGFGPLSYTYSPVIRHLVKLHPWLKNNKIVGINTPTAVHFNLPPKWWAGIPDTASVWIDSPSGIGITAPRGSTDFCIVRVPEIHGEGDYCLGSNSEADLERLVADVERLSSVNSAFEILLVTGEEIKDRYDSVTGNTRDRDLPEVRACRACMSSCPDYLDLYSLNPDKVALAVLKRPHPDTGGIQWARCLVWTTDKGTKIADRCYPKEDYQLSADVFDALKTKFPDIKACYPTYKSWAPMCDTGERITLDLGDDKYVPYLDSWNATHQETADTLILYREGARRPPGTEIESKSTEGGDIGDNSCTCDCCGDSLRRDSDCSVGRHGDVSVCEYCYDENYSTPENRDYAMLNEDLVWSDALSVYLDLSGPMSDYRQDVDDGEWYRKQDCWVCEVSGAWRSDDNTDSQVELHLPDGRLAGCMAHVDEAWSDEDETHYFATEAECKAWEAAQVAKEVA